MYVCMYAYDSLNIYNLIINTSKGKLNAIKIDIKKKAATRSNTWFTTHMHAFKNCQTSECMKLLFNKNS